MLLARTSPIAAVALLGLVTVSGCGPAGINGSVDVPAGATAEGATTINGSVNVGDGAKVGATATVNGGVRIGDNVTAESAKTVNGGIRIGNGTKISQGVDTVNGGIELGKGADVVGHVMTVNGGIRLNGAHVGGGITTFNGDVELARGSHVEGGIHVEKPEFMDTEHHIPRVVIGPDTVVTGTLKFDRTVKLFVNDTAKIGPVEGATAQMYSGDDTNNPSASAASPTEGTDVAATQATAEKPSGKAAAGGPEK
ncbi:MAG TPA: hypothetical protein VGO53_10970 [Steroidobacteraceae bacterium]|nr:hypothetical protein [Steroidobacteraceae bacterium]